MIKIEDMVEVTLDQKDDFLKVRETLTRIGVASKKEKVLYQSCHILHKQGKYYITHFKELFALDGKPTDITENDIAPNTATDGNASAVVVINFLLFILFFIVVTFYYVCILKQYL